MTAKFSPHVISLETPYVAGEKKEVLDPKLGMSNYRARIRTNANLLSNLYNYYTKIYTFTKKGEEHKKATTHTQTWLSRLVVQCAL